MGSYYRETRDERGKEIRHDATGQETSAAEPLPRTHADLDELATARGYVWSADNLTVAEKQAELGA